MRFRHFSLQAQQICETVFTYLTTVCLSPEDNVMNAALNVWTFCYTGTKDQAKAEIALLTGALILQRRVALQALPIPT